MTPVIGAKSRQVDDFLIPVTGDGDVEEEDKSTLEAEEVDGEAEDTSTQIETPTDEVDEQEDLAAKYNELKQRYEKDIGKCKMLPIYKH